MSDGGRRALTDLQDWQCRAQARLRQRMDATGCVFDFAVRRVAPGHTVVEADHRAVLGALFEPMHGGAAWTCDLPRARATRWDAACVTDATAFAPGWRIGFDRAPASVSPFEHLFQAFDDPPYTARCEPGLFADFCSAVGLLPGQGIEVLDWVGDPEREPERSAWSDYFDAGREWWGIWCLTVWNPRRRTLAALAASTTD